MSKFTRFLKRKPILSLVVGAAAFSAAAAFAASLTVSADSLGAGNATVSSCDADGISVAYTPTYSTTSPVGFKISSVTVSGIDATACANKIVKVEVVGAGSASLANGSATIDAASKTVTLSASPKAADVVDIHAVVYG